MKTCIHCGGGITSASGKLYCSLQCSADHRASQSIDLWLKKKIPGHKGKVMNVKEFVRDYMIKKSGHKCSKCGWNTPHPKTGKPPLEINHIDGDASNTYEENLEVLCPNCHSLTMNFKNFNTKSSRKR